MNIIIDYHMKQKSKTKTVTIRIIFEHTLKKSKIESSYNSTVN